MAAPRSREEERAWRLHHGSLWRSVPEPDVLYILAAARREFSRDTYLHALESVLTRPNPSPELIALAVAARLQGTT
jgi:hypothetical protein